MLSNWKSTASPQLPCVRLCGLDDTASRVVHSALVRSGYEVVDGDSPPGSWPPRTHRTIVLFSEPAEDSYATVDERGSLARRNDELPVLPSLPEDDGTLRVHTIEDEELKEIAAAWVETGLDPEALRGILCPSAPCESGRRAAPRERPVESSLPPNAKREERDG